MPFPTNINPRTLLIIAGLALPVVVLGVLTIHSHKEEVKQSVAPPTANAIETAKSEIEAEKKAHRVRLAELESITDAQWPTDKITHPGHATTREEGIAWQKSRLAWLDKITPQEWAKGREVQRGDWQEWQRMHPLRPAQQTVPKKPLPPIKKH